MRFKSGGTYAYKGASKELESMLASGSKGRFLHYAIKPVYSYAKLSERSVKPTPAMRRAARWALKVRSEAPASKRAGTPVGLARARDLANGRPLSKATLRRIRDYVNRAAGTADKAPSRDEQGDVPKAKQALGLWGARRGKAVARWAASQIRKLEAS